MVMYIAQTAWLLRSLNILVCYFFDTCSDADQKKTKYTPGRRLTHDFPHE